MENNQEKNNQELVKLIKENLALSKEMKGVLKKIHRYIIFRRIFMILKISFFVLIIFAALVWLPPFLQDFFGKINEVYNNIVTVTNLGT